MCDKLVVGGTFDVAIPQNNMDKAAAAKKDLKKGAPAEEGEGAGNAIKIMIDTANPDETRRVLGLKFDVIF